MAPQQELAGSEDPKPRIEEGTIHTCIHPFPRSGVLTNFHATIECAESHHCHPLKTKLETCTAVIEGGRGREGETCVEEFFDLMVCFCCRVVVVVVVDFG